MSASEGLCWESSLRPGRSTAMLARWRLFVVLLALVPGCLASSQTEALRVVRPPVVPTSVPATSSPSVTELAVDRIFADFQGADTPGCAVGVAQDGQPIVERAYGLANLDDGTPNRPDTVFEAASVSKQFTAAAIVLLAQQGRLSLDDDVRRYLPELPVYATPITLRRMLNHTSGLRDWGELEDLAGWPRGSRVYTQASVLDLVRRQRSLNFDPGTAWAYSNSNYNLAAIVVERVSHMTFSEFTRQNLFVPLGMTHTRWRDDYTRVVPGRATAYTMGDDHAWHVDMPIENAIGNGGLLTTVGDLLRWNANFAHPVVGDAAFVTTLEQSGTLEGGHATGYALGLFVDTVDGMRRLRHDGATAGYRSYLDRLPDQGLSIAVLCNASTAHVDALDEALARVFLPPRRDPAPTSVHELPPSAATVVATLAGLYRSERTGAPARVGAQGTTLRVDGSVADLDGSHSSYAAVSETTFTTPRGSRIEVLPSPSLGRPVAPTRLRITRGTGLVVDLARVTPWQPDAHTLEALQGEYVSDEVDARLFVCLRDGKLVLLQGPEHVVALRPVYLDAFTSTEPLWLVAFRRTGGRVTGLDIGSGRVWRVPFTRTGRRVCGPPTPL